MRADELYVPSVDEWLASQGLGNITFSGLYSILELEKERVQAHERIGLTDGEHLQAFILMFIISCDRLIRSRKINIQEKTILKEKRRLARAFFIDISKRMERKSGYAWVDGPLPSEKTAESLAEEWVRLGAARSKEEVYALQEKAQAATRLKREEQRKNYTPSYAWMDAPLFGTPREKGQVEE
nr:hypothetical protein [Nitrosomonas nitrosa]